jgi:SEC-C motif domain protein
VDYIENDRIRHLVTNQGVIMKLCPCCSTLPYASCCAPYINGSILPTTPEQLMRSRYTAYTQANVDYIAATMQSPAVDNYDKDEAAAWAKQAQWLSLEIVVSYLQDEDGFVEFIASFKDNGKHQRLHELSRFKLINGRWYYTDGEFKS